MTSVALPHVDAPADACGWVAPGWRFVRLARNREVARAQGDR